MEADPSLISLNVILGVLLVDILLSGDNAIVIALVCRSLPKSAQFRVMWLGILGAFLARLLLTCVASLAMQLPIIKLVGGLLLLRISIGLIVDNVQAHHPAVEDFAAPKKSVYEAAKTIILADVVMSLDNVLALSAVTNNNFEMLILGLVLSIPILMFGSSYIAKLLDMFPILLWGGAAVLGGVSGGLLIDDPLFEGMFSAENSVSHFVVPVLAAAFVVQTARIILATRVLVQNRPKPAPLWDILRGGQHSPRPAAPAPDIDLAAAPVVAMQTPEPAPVLAEAVPVPAAALVDGTVAHASVAVIETPGLTQAQAEVAATRGDKRIVFGLAAFMAVVGFAIYAMVNADPPAVPDRFVAYRCQSPVIVVQYRVGGGQVRLNSIKGVVDARLKDSSIAWDDYTLAAQTLKLQPPLHVLDVSDDQLVLDGGAFDHAVCLAAH